jgi:hypothetical protein
MVTGRRLLMYAATLCVLLAICDDGARVSAHIAGQEGQDVVTDPYYRVLDLVFPRPHHVPADFQRIAQEFVLRYLPASEAESQIVISVRRDGSLYIRTYTLPPGAKNIASQVADLFEHTNGSDADQIAKQINVLVREKALPSGSLNKLLARFSTICFHPPLTTTSTTITVDGTQYDLWLATADASHVHYSFFDSKIGQDRKAYPITRWMNEVKRAVKRSE